MSRRGFGRPQYDGIMAERAGVRQRGEKGTHDARGLGRVASKEVSALAGLTHSEVKKFSNLTQNRVIESI